MYVLDCIVSDLCTLTYFKMIMSNVTIRHGVFIFMSGHTIKLDRTSDFLQLYFNY